MGVFLYIFQKTGRESVSWSQLEGELRHCLGAAARDVPSCCLITRRADVAIICM